MKSNAKNLITLSLFIMFIFGFFIANIIMPDKDFSDEENRNLVSFPKFNFSDLLSGEYSSDLETYVSDQFVLRDNFVEIKSQIEQTLGKDENNGVYISTENTLIDKFNDVDFTNLDKNINAYNEFTKTQNIPVNLVVLPTQSDIYSYKLPKNAPTESQREVLDYISGKVTGFIDVYDVLMSKKHEYIFYNTDHHWTSLGAFYAYESIMKDLGKEPLSLLDFSKTLVTDEFYGTIFSKSGVRNVGPDSIHSYVDNREIFITDGNGTTSSLMYDESALEKKDKYEFFFKGNHPIVEISGDGYGSILIIKDSYANAIAPFFTKNYEKIYMVDLRFMKTSMSDFIRDNAIDEVLLLYSLPNFIDDSNIIFLK